MTLPVLRPEIEPRQWQRAALQEWTRNFSGIVEVVTGGGKTVFAHLCIQEFFREYPSGQCLVIVPTTSLLDQWYVGLADNFNLKSSDLACYGAGEFAEECQQFNVAVINTARSISDEISSKKPTFLIVDECHRAGSGENARALTNEAVATLGLSATPERERDDALDRVLIPALGEIVFRYDYAKAHRDGILSDFRLINVFLDPAEAATEKDTADRSFRSGGKNKKKTRQIGDSLRCAWALKIIHEHLEERTILFHESVSDLTRIVDELRNGHKQAVAYHSHLSPALRRDNLMMFRRRVVRILGTCRALDEGADLPEANVGIIIKSTSSQRQRIQRLGRLLRPSPGKNEALIYTFYTTDEERARLATEQTALEGVAKIEWKRGSRRAK